MAADRRNGERGVTLLVVAIALVAIIGMAALAIDVVTLYLAREEAQRAADAGALAGARILSLSGVTGDPNNTDVNGTTIAPWPAACTLATQVAQAVASQNSVDSAVAGTPQVSINGGTANSGCGNPSGTAYSLNPQVQVQVVRNGIPSLFSRIWSSATNTISATAMAEAYNSSDSLTYTPTGDIVPVSPRCVKPWVIPDIDPISGNRLLSHRSGTINNPGIQVNPATTSGGGIVGESFTLTNACGNGSCGIGGSSANGSFQVINYAPALISTSTTPIAVPSCANIDSFQQAVGGCDVATSYACGTNNGAQLDYTSNPYPDTNTAVDCLIRAPGQDNIDTTSFPFQITAGASNPYVSTGQPITASTSIVTLPIFNSSVGGFGGGNQWPGGFGNNQPQITVIGFMQVFIQNRTGNGNMSVTVLNVTGCGDGVDPTGNPVFGSSPVPVRLITPP